eukprot:12328884-Karenia_brevis.AAC.1
MENAEESAEELKVLTSNVSKSSSSEPEELTDQEVFNSCIPYIIESCQKCPECLKEMAMEFPPLFD